MKKFSALSSVLLGTVLVAVATRPAAAAESVLKFSDPAKPGRIVVQVAFGDVSITGTDTKEVRITSEGEVQGASPVNDDGFRRLDGGSGFSTGEADNVITISSPGMFPGRGGRHGDDADVEIVVPRETSVTIERRGPGDMEVREISGDLEIRGAIGDIELDGLRGGVLIESINGDVEATLAALTAGKPVSISVVHGDVEVAIPADARANVELRTLQGEMLTNFSADQLKTKFESATGGVDVNVDVDVEIDVAMASAEKARKDVEKARKQAEKDAKAAAAAASGQPGHPGMPPIPPVPPMPPMPGGKRVVGALNGGGTELTIVTITGDITLQKAE